MIKKETINGYKYIYYFNNLNNLTLVNMYKIKLKGFFKVFEGSYKFIYNEKNQLIKQENYIKNIGITESIIYIYHNDKIIKKEYYNDKMALRYYIVFSYSEDEKPEEMKIFKNNNDLITSTRDHSIINEYINKIGKKIDFLSEMLDFIDFLKLNK